MASRRSFLDLKISVLRALVDGETLPTRIMYRCHLNWVNLNNVMSSLILGGFVKESVSKGLKRPRKEYMITPRGVETLNEYSQLEKIFNINIV